MHGFNLVSARRDAGPDRPEGLIGHGARFERFNSCNRKDCGDLSQNAFTGTARVPFLERFAHAENRMKPGVIRRLHFLCHAFVRFAVKRPAFRMPDNAPPGPKVTQHIAAHLACEGTRANPVAHILGSDMEFTRDGLRVELRREREKVRRRNTEPAFTADRVLAAELPELPQPGV